MAFFIRLARATAPSNLFSNLLNSSGYSLDIPVVSRSLCTSSTRSSNKENSVDYSKNDRREFVNDVSSLHLKLMVVVSQILDAEEAGLTRLQMRETLTFNPFVKEGSKYPYIHLAHMPGVAKAGVKVRIWTEKDDICVCFMGEEREKDRHPDFWTEGGKKDSLRKYQGVIHFSRENCKADEIKAFFKNGVLCIIPGNEGGEKGTLSPGEESDDDIIVPDMMEFG